MAGVSPCLLEHPYPQPYPHPASAGQQLGTLLSSQPIVADVTPPYQPDGSSVYSGQDFTNVANQASPPRCCCPRAVGLRCSVCSGWGPPLLPGRSWAELVRLLWLGAAAAWARACACSGRGAAPSSLFQE